MSSIKSLCELFNASDEHGISLKHIDRSLAQSFICYLHIAYGIAYADYLSLDKVTNSIGIVSTRQNEIKLVLDMVYQMFMDVDSPDKIAVIHKKIMSINLD